MPTPRRGGSRQHSSVEEPAGTPAGLALRRRHPCDLVGRLCKVQFVSCGAAGPGCRRLRLFPFNLPCHEQAPPSPPQSPKVELEEVEELDMTWIGKLLPELSRLQLTTADDSDEDMELEDELD